MLSHAYAHSTQLLAVACAREVPEKRQELRKLRLCAVPKLNMSFFSDSLKGNGESLQCASFWL
jgi:hypothetical protein